MQNETRYQEAHASLTGDRTENQDRCILVRSGQVVLMGLADGMGGHPRGEAAARIFTDNCNNLLQLTPQPISDPKHFLVQLLQDAHRDIVEFGLAQTPPVDPRTTAVAALIQDDTLYWVHVGDSRLYLFRNGETVARTFDHSYVEQLREEGVIAEWQMASHPQRNLVTRCLGGGDTPPEIDSGQAKLTPGDLVVLCSDGLWSSVDMEFICDTLNGDEGMRDCAARLADEAAMSAFPDSDNVTLLALKWLSDEARCDNPTSRKTTGEDAADNLAQAIADLQQLVESYESDKKRGSQ